MQSTQTDTIIQIGHISKRYRSVVALDDISLEIPRGAIYGLIGPNGAGKTTLLRILAALIAPSSGHVWFEGKDVSHVPSLIQRKIGYMPDIFGIYPDITTEEYLQFYAGIHGISGRQRAHIVSDLLELVDLTAYRKTLVETLSRGMQQRLCLARALVHDPDLILLDEPAAGLDPRTRVELRELIHTLHTMGKTVVISSHVLLELAEMCTNIAVIQGGRLVLSGDIETLSQHFQTNRQIAMRLLEPDKILVTLELLRSLPDILSADVAEDEMIYTEFSGDDQALHHLLRTLIAHELPIISFAPRSIGGRLEEAFLRLTEGNSQP
ncbi:MAG TPA: ABC transporter ATP-binding protein [Ktedonobacteraceae bacterium]|jgi:ABC-2 type transport system ATP-binding protein|nr:ABC transporter ATP-binding protein [Ktedonobacteraceae bacterium]